MREIEGRIEQHVRGRREVVIPTRDEFDTLAADLEAVWNDPHSDGRLKKRILRTLIQGVVVDVDAAAGEIILTVHWRGGVHTELRVPRRRRGQNSSQASTEIIEAVRVLARVCSDAAIGGLVSE